MHLKPRDIVEMLLFIIGFVSIFAIAGYLETAPLALTMWLVGIIATALWVCYVILVVHQRKKESAMPVLWIRQDGRWISIPGGRVKPSSENIENFNQE